MKTACALESLSKFYSRRRESAQMKEKSARTQVRGYGLGKSSLLCVFQFAFVCSLCGPAPAGEARRPNILFIIFDDWNRSHAGAYGCDWVKTPNFDRVPREGLLFRNAFTSNPKGSPCRASILTGRNSRQLREAVSHLSIWPSDFETVPDLLERLDYAVGLTGKR